MMRNAMKLARADCSYFGNHKENPPVKRALLIIGAALLFVNSLVIPTVVHADGGTTGTNCDGKMCKP